MTYGASFYVLSTFHGGTMQLRQLFAQSGAEPSGTLQKALLPHKVYRPSVYIPVNRSYHAISKLVL
jgi:hypothetical protein